jgi:hypothetical protein
MRNKNLNNLINNLPTNLDFEEISTLAKKFNIDPILLFLLYNDYVIKTLRPDVILDETIEENIEDWV